LLEWSATREGLLIAVNTLPGEPIRVDEPKLAAEYSDVLTEVATKGTPVIVRRNGEDRAAVIPVEQLQQLRELQAAREAEELAARIDWKRLVRGERPPQSWFDDDDNPFEPEEEPAA
jgi:prevent-host-death family protein